jgi:hypothetical protein
MAAAERKGLFYHEKIQREINRKERTIKSGELQKPLAMLGKENISS